MKWLKKRRAKKKSEINPEPNINKALIQRVPNSQIIDSNFNPVSPYGTVGLSFHRFASLPPQDLGIGSDVLVSRNITFTAAHILVHNGEDADRSFSQIGAVPNGSGGNNGSGAVNTFNGIFEFLIFRWQREINTDQILPELIPVV